MATRLLERGFALVAAGNLKGSQGCWETMDVPVVQDTLRAWRKKHKLRSSLPLFALGPSSGGFFATQFARHVRDVRALSIQVSVPSYEDVQSPLPSGSTAFPPLQVILMQRDVGKLRDAQSLGMSGGGSAGSRQSAHWADSQGVEWAGRRHAEMLISRPKPVHPDFFSSAIPGLPLNASSNVRAELVRAGFINDATSMVVSHPSRGTWRDAVRRGLLDEHGKQRSDRLPQGSLQLAMDAVFARLDLAYAYHASTCEHIEATADFFHRAAHTTEVDRVRR